MLWIDKLEAEYDLEEYLPKIKETKHKNKLLAGTITVNVNITCAMNQLKVLQAEIMKTTSMAERVLGSIVGGLT